MKPKRVQLVTSPAVVLAREIRLAIRRGGYVLLSPLADTLPTRRIYNAIVQRGQLSVLLQLGIDDARFFPALALGSGVILDAGEPHAELLTFADYKLESEISNSTGTLPQSHLLPSPANPALPGCAAPMLPNAVAKRPVALAPTHKPAPARRTDLGLSYPGSLRRRPPLVG